MCVSAHSPGRFTEVADNVHHIRGCEWGWVGGWVDGWVHDIVGVVCSITNFVGVVCSVTNARQ